MDTDGNWVANDSKAKFGTQKIKASYKVTKNSSGAYDQVITNEEVKFREIEITKKWVGGSANQVEVQLYKDGVVEGAPATLNAANNWTITFTNLPVRDAGRTVDKMCIRDSPDTEEAARGTDPKDPTSKPTTSITPISNQTVVEGNPISSVTVTVDNPNTTVTVSNLPNGVTYNPATKTISGTPSITDWTPTEETREITVTVTAVSYTHLDVYKRQVY